MKEGDVITNALATAGTEYATGSFSRDTSLAAGTQAVTGVGFTPKAVFFLMAETNSREFSIGFDVGTTQGVIYDRTTDSFATTSAYSIFDNETNGSVEYLGQISSFDSDGFTVTWAKNLSPTGTLSIQFLAMK